MHCEHHLPEVIRAAHSARRFAHCLDGGQQKPDQNADDRNHNQEFDKRKTVEGPGAGRTLLHGVKLFSTPDTELTTMRMDVTGFTEWVIHRYPPCVDRMDIAEAAEQDFIISRSRDGA